MTELATNLFSGLLGALLGAFAGIYAVRHSHVLQSEANLRSLLVAQRLALKMMGSENVGGKLKQDYLPIFQAYQNLRSVYPRCKRNALNSSWRNYKGDYEDALPLFGTLTVEGTAQSSVATSCLFQRDEVIEKLDEFLKFLG